jgi:hypothetical protein
MAVTVSAGTMTLGGGAAQFQSTLDVTGGTLTAGASPGTLAVTGATNVNGGGTFNGGASGTVTLAALTLGNATPTAGAFNTSGATATIAGLFSLTNSSTFNGGTGTTSFTSTTAPTLTSGTFTVGSAGTSGKVVFSADATFASGATLAFPSIAGELSLTQGKTLTVAGTLSAATSFGATKPKIDCSGCSATQGIGVTLSGTLNANGLEFDNATSAGVTIPSGATITLLKNLVFKNNAANGSGGTHLAITLGTAVLNVPGCYFDTTAAKNVTLNGTVGLVRGARAIFEYQSVATNGSGAGNSRDADGDSNADNYGDVLTAPYYGSVVEWVSASPTDTSGMAAGFPTAAFDWNTFTWYGIYAAYKDTSGAGSNDILWLRNTDGTPAYSFSVPQSSGDLVGTPVWDAVNEVTLNLDVNGDGDKADTDVRIVYLGTSLGHIVKLIDSGSGLARPASGKWASDFTSANVSTITSPLGNDGTNLYFGGTNGGATRVFGVQIAGGANEATLQREVGSVGPVTTSPSISTTNGSTYVYLGSTAVAGQAYVYRVNMTNSTVDASYSGSTTSINGGVVLVNGRAYAVSDGGAAYALAALSFSSGGFTDLTGFPYQTAAAKPIKNAPWVDYRTNNAYFGDDGGNVYGIDGAGAALTGFPFSISGSIKITSTPIYLVNSGVIAIGADDGYLYFIDRNNGAGPSVFKRFFVSNGGSVSSVSYNTNTSAYMVSSSDGHLTFINGSDVPDPTPGTI